MNRYALWKYILIAVVLIVAALYTLPNFSGESPAVQVSSGKSTVKVDETVLKNVEKALADASSLPTVFSMSRALSKTRCACVLIRRRVKSSCSPAK